MGLVIMGDLSPSQLLMRGKFREFRPPAQMWDTSPMESDGKVRAICDFIVAEMEAREISKRALSARAGLSESAVRDILKKVDNPGIGTLYKIAEALGVPFEDMMAAGDEDEVPNHIRAWREFHKMSQADLAAACKPPTTAAVIALVEGYKHGPSVKWLHRLAPALKTSPGFLADIDPLKADTRTMELAMAVPEEKREQVNQILETFLKTA